MTLSSAEIKRQILKSAAKSEIKRKMDTHPPGITEGEQIEMGNQLESLTRMSGWTLVESYMLGAMNLVGLALSDGDNKDQKGVARGFIQLMQWIEVVIQRGNELKEKERLKYAKAEDVPEDKAD